ncbi:MAG TPA: sulfite oxidase-like oxidoreductase [Planctomycetaceae bacterium]|nr:sulfite oxidase-like oxidoreductase [Planctomycetaceae bacterium]
MPTPDDKYQAGAPRPPHEIGAGIIISSDTRRTDRLPPGQSRTRKWPVLHYGDVPTVPMAKWRLDIFGLVERPLSFTWEQFQALPRVRVYADFHCVTRWSRLDNIWEGVSVRELLSRAGVKPEAKFVVPHGYDSGWTTNLPLADFDVEDALVADRHDGEPLSPDHGGPCRLIVPRLYAWKSAKWLKAIELVADDRPGYWEQGGYHNHGDPWTEERLGE